MFFYYINNEVYSESFNQQEAYFKYVVTLGPATAHSFFSVFGSQKFYKSPDRLFQTSLEYQLFVYNCVAISKLTLSF